MRTWSIEVSSCGRSICVSSSWSQNAVNRSPFGTNTAALTKSSAGSVGSRRFSASITFVIGALLTWSRASLAPS
jgi:hypothetical protein